MSEREEHWDLRGALDDDDVGSGVAVGAVDDGNVEAALFFLDGAWLQALGFVRGRKGECPRVLPFLTVFKAIVILLLLSLLLLVGFGAGLTSPVRPVGLVGVVDGHGRWWWRNSHQCLLRFRVYRLRNVNGGNVVVFCTNS